MRFPRSLVRPLLHTVHLLTFGLLFATGLLLMAPALRAAITGGYSHLLRSIHWWGGVAFVVLPLSIAAWFGPRSLAPPHREEPRARRLWQLLHLALTVGMSLAFAVTGFVIWARRSLPDVLVDPCVLLHEWLTWAAAALLGVHLAEVAIARAVERVRAAAAE